MIQSSLSSPSLTTAIASLSDVTCITESLQLVESITRDWLKSESQKPVPPAPADLQPAVHTLWRCSIIRKNLLYFISTPTPTTPTPAKPSTPTQPQSDPNTASEAAILRSLSAVSAPKLMDLVSRKLVQHTNAEIKAIQARRESAAPATITQSTPSTQSTHSTPSAPSAAPQPLRSRSPRQRPLPHRQTHRPLPFVIRHSLFIIPRPAKRPFPQIPRSLQNSATLPQNAPPSRSPVARYCTSRNGSV